jgi:hypothetical protein
MERSTHVNTCGCRQCGGSQAREDAILARRVVAYANEIINRRGTGLADRVVRPGLYERLLMGHSWSAPR